MVGSLEHFLPVISWLFSLHVHSRSDAGPHGFCYSLTLETLNYESSFADEDGKAPDS